MMNWEPNITVRALQPVIAALNILGYDSQVLLQSSHISPAILSNPEGYIPHRTMMQFWQQAVATTGDQHLGHHLATVAPIGSLEVHAYALLSSPTLQEAYHRGCRYQRLIHETTHLTLEEKEQEGILRHSLAGGQSAPRHPAEFLVTLWVRLGRLVTGTDWQPRRVCFAHTAPEDLLPHQNFFHSPIQYRTGQTALHIANDILDLPNPQADQGLLQVLDRYAELLVEQAPRVDTMGDRTRTALLQALKTGTPTADTVAKSLNISVRTLHRSLQREGTRFQDILDQVRHEQALQLLASPRTTIAEVAFLLGYAEVSSFHRACQRWTGKTPAEIRASLI